MDDFGFREMQQIQVQLQEKYKDKWKQLSPDLGKEQLLWLMIEPGRSGGYHKEAGQSDDHGRYRSADTFY